MKPRLLASMARFLPTGRYQMSWYEANVASITTLLPNVTQHGSVIAADCDCVHNYLCTWGACLHSTWGAPHTKYQEPHILWHSMIDTWQLPHANYTKKTTKYTVVHEIFTTWNFQIASDFTAWNYHWLCSFSVYFYYKIHFHCMNISLIGYDSENSKNFMQWTISWCAAYTLRHCNYYHVSWWRHRKQAVADMKSNDTSA